MKRNSFIVGIISLILLVSLLSGCGKDDSTPKSLSGRYIGEENASFSELEFFSDGKYTSSHSNYEGDYSIDGNRIRLEGILVDSRIYYFKVNGNTLELSSGENFEYPEIYRKK